MATHALAKSRTHRSLMILALLTLGLALAVAARYALLPLIWHTAAMHYHGRPTGMHFHGRPLMHLHGVIAMHYHAIVSRMHYFG